MDLFDFFECRLKVVIFCDLAVVRGHWVLSGCNLDAVWLGCQRGWEKPLVRLEIFHSQSCTHNYKAQGLVLETWLFSRWVLVLASVCFTLFVSQLAACMGDSREQTH